MYYRNNLKNEPEKEKVSIEQDEEKEEQSTEIKEEINETGSAIIASAESSINAAVQKLNEELEKADINGMKQSIDTIADVASAALGELRNRLDEQEKINSYMFNLLYSKIKELETKIK